MEVSRKKQKIAEEIIIDDDEDENQKCQPKSSSTMPKNKKLTLESLFRPPLEIMHRGNFESVE